MAVIAGRNIRVTANRSWCGIAWTNPGGRIEGRTLPELAALFARASQAEQALATLRELIHTASGLDDHRYSAEQMVKEMAKLWQGASDDCEKAEQALATVTAERDEALRVSEARRADLTLLRRLVMGGVGLLTTGEGKETWAAIRVLEEDRDALKANLAEAERERDAARGEASIHYAVIEQYRSRLAKTERVVEAARKMLVEHDTELQETENEARLARALRALGEDSGGSGAAQAGGQSPPPARATGESAQSQGRQLGATQRAAGANDEPPLRELRSEAHRRACEQAAEQLAGSDSPVGVAATAEADIDRLVAARTGEGRHMVTRAEIEELKAQVEKYENLFQAMMGYAT